MLDDESLISEFIAESREHLTTIEPDLLVLEQEGEAVDPEITNRIFRAIHSIKGAAGFFGFESLKHLSHVMENLLMQIRDKKITPRADVVEPLLFGVDRLNEMLSDIRTSDSVPYQDLLESLERCLSLDSPRLENLPEKSSSDENPVTASLQPSPEVIQELLLRGQNLYVLSVDYRVDLLEKGRTVADFLKTMETMGQILETNYIETEETDFQILYASVLEKDLLAMGLSMAESDIALYDANSFPDAQVSETPVAVVVLPPTVETPAIGLPPEKPEPVSPASARKVPASGGESVESVRVRIELLNKLMDLAGEMVLSRNQLLRTLGEETQHIPGLSNIVQNIDLITSDLQEHIMQTRMQPVGSIFGKFPRIVRDLARQMGKEIELEIFGEEVELDKSIVESLSDPLTHLIRNCCDHALETPEERVASGKPNAGKITMRAFHEDGQVNIAIRDDGRGINTAKIIDKAIKLGLITENDVAGMSAQELVNLVFLPGLSTAETISDVSGRGVGMDVVKTNITRLGGHIQVDTEAGKGTTFLLHLPLTLAIIPSLIVGVAAERFAIPQINLVELVRVLAAEIPERIEKVGNAPVLRLRGKLLPLVRLADVLKLDRTYCDGNERRMDRRQEITDRRLQEDVLERILLEEQTLLNRRKAPQSDYNILVLKVGSHQFGLIVDELFDTEEIVVKPLSGYLKNCKCFSGATIMGDGRVAMILDAGGILNDAQLSFDEIEADQSRRDAEDVMNSSAMSSGRSVLVFHNAPDEYFAMPLDTILRLEKIKLADINRIGHKEFITYAGKGLPLIRLEHYLPVSSSPYEQEEVFLIIPKESNGAAGIIVSEIVDTLHTDTRLELSQASGTGLQGTAVLNNCLTMFIDPPSLLRQAGIFVSGGSDVY